ncbi:MAG: hypothetical protein Crog4KO_34620 [Crocinitomicaceae bacterium]
MDIFSVGDLVVALGVSSTTIRNWTEQEEFQVYLSSRAKRTGEFESAKQREYTQEDLYVLNTIRIQKTHRNSWDDVADMLSDGYRNRDLPEAAALVLPETKAETFHLITVARAQIEGLQKRVEELEDEVESSQAQLEKERQARIKDIERLSVTVVKEDMKDLYKMIGRLEHMLERAGIDPETGKPTDGN